MKIEKSMFGFAATVAMVCAGVSHASFSNFGPNGEFDNFGGYSTPIEGENVAMAMRFQAGKGGQMSSVSLGLLSLGGTTATVRLHVDGGNAGVGAVLGTWTVSNIPPSPGPQDAVTITIDDGPELVEGTFYYLSVRPEDGQVLWANNVVESMDRVARQIESGHWLFMGFQLTLGAFAVETADPTPPNPADLNGDGSVGVPDLLILLASWGPCKDCDDCPADLTGDCTVGVPDLLFLLANWG